MKYIKNILSAVFLLAATTVVSAQSPRQLDFGANFGGTVRAMDVDLSGRTYVTGVFTGNESFGSYNLNSNGDTDVFVMMFDAAGNVSWAVSFGNDQVDDVYGIDVDASGNVLVTGSFIGSVDFDPSPDDFIIDGQPVNTDGFVAQFDDEGLFIWAGSVSGETNEIIFDVATDASRNMYLTGSFDGDTDLDPTPGVQTVPSSTSGVDAFFIRVNADHTLGWIQTVGNSLEARGINVAVDFSGAPVFTGHYLGTLDINPGSGTQNISSSGGSTFRDIFVTKLSGATGAFTWGKSIGGNQGNYPYSMSIDGQLNIYISGQFEGTGDFDPDGSITNTLTSNGDADIFVTKFHPSGALLWAKSFGGDGADHGLGVFADNSNVYVTGDFTDDVDFGTSGTHNLFSFGSTDAFILNLDPSGNFKWIGQMGGDSDEDALAVVGDDSGNVYVAGNFFSRPVDLDPSCDELNLDAEIAPWYVIKIGTNPSDCVTITQQPISADVCPFTNVVLTVGVSGSVSGYQWQIMNQDGDFEDIEDAPFEYSGTDTDELTIFTNNTHGDGLYRVQITPDAGPFVNSDAASVNVGPKAPIANSVTNCGPGAVTLVASGGVDGQYRWYTGPSGGTLISGEVNHFLITPILSSSRTYYVSIDDGNCEGPKTELVAIISTCTNAPGLVAAKAIGNSGMEQAGNILILSDGNLLVTGSFQQTVDFDLGLGVTNKTATAIDGFVAKYTPAFDLIWVKQFEGTGSVYPTEAGEDQLGNIYVGGTFTNANDFDTGAGTITLTSGVANFNDVFAVKLNSNGDSQWAKRLAGDRNLHDGFADIVVDPGGGVYVAGYFWQNFSIDGVNKFSSAGGTDIFLVKFSTSGVEQWSRQIGNAVASGNAITESAIALALNEEDLFLLGNATNGTTDVDPGTATVNIGLSDPNVFVVKLDIGGIYQDHFFYDSDDIGSNASDIAVDVNGNIYTSGTFSGSVDFGANGNNLILDSSPVGVPNGFVCKHQSNGELIWAKQFGVVSLNQSFGGKLFIDDDAAVIVSGLFQGQIDFDPGPLEYILEGSSLLFSTYAVKLNTDGDFNWAVHLERGEPSAASTIQSGLAVGDAGDIYMTGSFNGSVDFDPSDCKYNVASKDVSLDFFFWHLSPNAPIVCIDKQPVGVNTCADAEGVFSISATGAAGITYQWQKKNTTTGVFENITNGALYKGATSTNLIVYSTNASVVGTYRAVVSAPSSVSKNSDEVGLSISGNRPSAPITEGASSCNNNVQLTLKASGGTGQYLWYATDEPINSIHSGTTYITPPLTTSKTYYVSIKSESCESARTPATAVPNAGSTAPGTTGASRCGAGTLTLAASGGVNGQFRWYSQPSGGVAISGQVNNTFETPSISTTTTYYVSIQLNDCETPRAPVVATISACTGNQPPVITSTETSIGAGGIATIDIGPLLSDPDNNIDLTTLKIVVQPKSGAVATISNGQLSIDYSSSSFTGDDELTIEVCDAAGSCSTQVIMIRVDGDISIFNAVSPNGDGKNDVFFLQYIDTMESTKENHVKIYNRWGDLVFDVKNYNNTTNAFKGNSNSGKELSSGTYFYKIEFKDRKTETGYLSLQR